MKRQLTRKLSTAEFAHSHSGHGPPPNVGPGRRQSQEWQSAQSVQRCTSLRPGPFTYTHAYHLSVLGGPPPPPRVSPVSARRRAAARALRQRGMRQRATGRPWRFVAGATAEGGGGEALGRRAKTSKMATPCGHQPTNRGAVGSSDRRGYTVVHHYRHVPVSSLESSRPPRSPSGCGGSSSAWRV